VKSSILKRINSKIFSFIIVGLLLASISTNAQKSSITGKKFSGKSLTQKRKPLNYINYIGISANLATVLYVGDLCSGLDCVKPLPSFGFSGEYRFSESLLFRSEFNYIRLSATDAGGKNEDRGLSFYSNTMDFNVNVVYDIFEFNKMYRRRVAVAPYITIGVGFVTVNPKVKYLGEKYNLRPFQTEGVDYSPIALTIPYGAGFRFNLNPHNTIALEGTVRYTFTDYLDDVSSRYDVNKQSLPDDDISKILSDRRDEHGYTKPLNIGLRGGASVKDMYAMYSVKFTHTFWVTRQRYNVNSNQSKFRLIKSIQKK
jgi:Domain of unknown function (DUF6089)